MRVVHALLIALAITLHTNPAEAQCGPSGCYSPPAAAPSYGELPRAVQRSIASAVRIVHREASGASLGSGTLVATDREASWVLTCAHLFTERGTTSVRLGSQRVDATIESLDREHDLALLKTAPLRGSPVEVAEVSSGGELIACGFGGTGRLRAIRGVITGYATAQGAAAPSLRIRGAVRSGDSGGPVFDQSGRLVAVVWGQRAGETYAMGGKPLRRIMSRIASGVSRLKPVERRTAEPALEDSQWKRQIEERLDRLAGRPTPPAPVLPDDLARRDDLRDLSTRWDRRFERLRGEVREGVAVVPPDRGSSVTTNVFAGLRRWGLSEALLAAGVGAAPVAAAMIGMRLWRKRRLRAGHAATATSLEESLPVAVDTPPPPQRVVPETHYVSYERDEFAKAHQWASEQLVRKFPGSVEMLASLDSLIRQQLNGKD